MRQKRHNKLFLLAGIVLVLVIASTVGFYTAKKTKTQQMVTKISPAPTSTEAETWHINNTNQWATYANQDAPFTMKYPPQWGYMEQTDRNPFITPPPPLHVYAIMFHQVPMSDQNHYNIYILWGGNFGDPQNCFAHPSVQLKNEVLPGCEFKDDNGNDRMQIDKITPKLGLFIDISASNGVTRAQLLKILSTLSFTK